MTWRVDHRGPGLVCLLALGAGCNQQQQQDIPNRVLDRPTDVTLACAEFTCNDDKTECTTVPQPLSVCVRDTGTCSSENPHLVGFVANSERNEIAMFAKCANRLIDMNVDVPGYNFIPVGILPTDLDTSADGCRVISANVGSCDLSLLDVPRLAGFAFGDTEVVEEPSTLVTNLIPSTFDEDAGRRRPLGARPGQVLSVPASLTQAPGVGVDENFEGGCDPRAPRSAYVTFPTCNLLAEIDLQTGDVLQSRQFVHEDGAIAVYDRGVTPSCPVECPTQFEDGELPMVGIDGEGPFIQALELSLPPVRPSDDQDPTTPEDPDAGMDAVEFDAADEAFTGRRLYVGGLGSDVLFEIPISDTGVWDPTVQQIELSAAGGIKQIRASPPVNAEVDLEIGSDYSQFLYVVAGDGSTRVVGRELIPDQESLLVECETQLDPTLVPEAEILACVPVTQSPNGGQPTQRRGFSRGPGIRPGRGEEVTDWMFRKSYTSSAGAGPVNEPSTVAVGVTNGGWAVYTMINQSRASGETEPSDLGGPTTDASVMDVRMFPHSLWPQPTTTLREQLPLVQDRASEPVIQGELDADKSLAPSLRMIDAAYLRDDLSATRLNFDGNFDRLGSGSADANSELYVANPLYEEDVVRVVTHDYRSWGATGSTAWTLEWEGTIAATRSATGRVQCDRPGWPEKAQKGWGGTCLEPAQLHDASASFCDDGVLPGDKLVIIGCRDDDECGDGRICLLESAAGSESSGICISGVDAGGEKVADRVQRLRQICAPFISDPCGEAQREFEILEAYQDRLVFDAILQPPISYLRTVDDQGDCPVNSVPRTPSLDNGVVDDEDCLCLSGYSPCDEGCCEDDTYLSGQAPILELEGRFVCAEEQPEGGCLTDADCVHEDENGDEVGHDLVCIDTYCRQACEPGEDDQCLVGRLPGPGCFAEFVQYQVALENSFRVSGPGLNFVTDRVEAVEDPTTGELACQPTQNPDISQLLTSRLPLPASDDPDDPSWLSIPACPNDNVLPTDPNPCRIDVKRESNRFHIIAYEDEPYTVSALRFSNPVFSVILDLTDLRTLASEVPDYPDQFWPLEVRRFTRSRLTRGYRLEFGFESGYQPFAERLLLEGRPTTYPIRIVPGPEANVAYVVDGSGPGTTSSIRGQVLRVTLGELINTDQNFNGVR